MKVVQTGISHRNQNLNMRKTFGMFFILRTDPVKMKTDDADDNDDNDDDDCK